MRLRVSLQICSAFLAQSIWAAPTLAEDKLPAQARQDYVQALKDGGVIAKSVEMVKGTLLLNRLSACDRALYKVDFETSSVFRCVKPSAKDCGDEDWVDVKSPFSLTSFKDFSSEIMGTGNDEDRSRARAATLLWSALNDIQYGETGKSAHKHRTAVEQLKSLAQLCAKGDSVSPMSSTLKESKGLAEPTKSSKEHAPDAGVTAR